MRARAWLMFAIALALALIYSTMWLTYAGIYTHPRYRQLPPGAGTTYDGATYTLLKLTQTDVVVDGDEQHPAQAGAFYVVAELQVVTNNKKFTGCGVDLLADGKRTWEAESSFFDRKLPGYCDTDDYPIVPGRPWRYEQIYQVPVQFRHELYGIAVNDPSSAAPIPVLTPKS